MNVIINLALICKVNIAADSAGIANADCGTHGRTAAEKKLVAHAFTQKLHCLIHNFAAALAVSGCYALAVEEVELNHIVAPLVEHGVKHLFDVFSCFIVINIKSVCAAPCDTAELRLALFILDKPVRMLLGNSRNLLTAEGSNPYACKVALFVHLIGNILHTLGEFVAIIKPVTYIGLIAVVNLKDGCFFLSRVKTVEVTDDDILSDILEIVVPRGVAAHCSFSCCGHIHHAEVFIKHLVIAALKINNVKHLPGLGYALAESILAD